MGLRYTGRADTFTHNGKTYVKDEHGRTPVIHGLTKHDAEHMMNMSALHTFEEDGEDLAEKLTAPETSKK